MNIGGSGESGMELVNDDATTTTTLTSTISTRASPKKGKRQ